MTSKSWKLLFWQTLRNSTIMKTATGLTFSKSNLTSKKRPYTQRLFVHVSTRSDWFDPHFSKANATIPGSQLKPHDLRQWTEKACELQTMALFVSFCFVNQQCSQTWNNNCHRRWTHRKEQRNSDAESGSPCSANVSWSFKIKHHVMAIRKKNTATWNACELQFETLLLFSFTWMLQRSSHTQVTKWWNLVEHLAHMIRWSTWSTWSLLPWLLPVFLWLWLFTWSWRSNQHKIRSVHIKHVITRFLLADECKLGAQISLCQKHC